jgi:glutamine amidotransferase
MKKIVVIDYGAGNVKSVCNALDRLDALYEISGDSKVVAQAEKVIFPGVGAAGATMAVLRERGLDEAIRGLRVPVLGICLGMQLLFEKSEEGDTKGLGILPGVVKKFNAIQRWEAVSTTLKIPQIGWNLVKFADSKSPLIKDIPDESYFYFVHSYAAPLCEFTTGVAFYGQPFTAMIQKDNFFGTQFHPEKSGDVGQQLLGNFLNL